MEGNYKNEIRVAYVKKKNVLIVSRWLSNLLCCVPFFSAIVYLYLSKNGRFFVNIGVARVSDIS